MQHSTSLCIALKIGEQNYTLTRSVPSVTLSEVLEFIAAQQRKPLESIQELVLKCSGCQRRIWLTEEAYQPIPVPCCRVQSLMLEQEKSDGMESGSSVGELLNLEIVKA